MFIGNLGEEAKNPETAIPFATFISMSVVTLAYILMSSALTLMIPYYRVIFSFFNQARLLLIN